MNPNASSADLLMGDMELHQVGQAIHRERWTVAESLIRWGTD